MDVVNRCVHLPGSEAYTLGTGGLELQQQRDSEPHHTGDGHVRCFANPSRTNGVSFFYTGATATNDKLTIFGKNRFGAWSEVGSISGVIDNVFIDGANWQPSASTTKATPHRSYRWRMICFTQRLSSNLNSHPTHRERTLDSSLTTLCLCTSRRFVPMNSTCPPKASPPTEPSRVVGEHFAERHQHGEHLGDFYPKASGIATGLGSLLYPTHRDEFQSPRRFVFPTRKSRTVQHHDST